MDLNALKTAVTGAGVITAPAASPNSTGANAFTQSAIGNIQNLASVGTRANASRVASNALYGGVSQQATADAANATAAAKVAKQKAEDDAQLLKDLQDPSKYSRKVNNSGGYDFYAPNGEKVSAKDFADVSGKHVTDVLKGSQNTVDQNFINDYKEVQKLGELTQQGGKAMADYLKKNPDIKKQLDQENIKTYADVVKKFRASYPQFFPQSMVKDIGNAKNNNVPIAGSGGGFMDKLKSFFGQ